MDRIYVQRVSLAHTGRARGCFLFTHPLNFHIYVKNIKFCLPSSSWQTLQDQRVGRRPFSALICRTHQILGKKKGKFSLNCLNKENKDEEFQWLNSSFKRSGCSEPCYYNPPWSSLPAKENPIAKGRDEIWYLTRGGWQTPFLKVHLLILPLKRLAGFCYRFLPNQICFHCS